MNSRPKPKSLLLSCILLLGLILQNAPVLANQTIVSPIAPPEVSAEAVYVMDATANIPLYSKNPDERRAIGSVVKIMTALVTLKWVENPDETEVTIIESDLVEPEYSQMFLQVGDTLTVTQLLYGLMLPSGGDAANALCRYVGGLISGVTEHPEIACESFVGEMNSYAAELGLDNSRFTNPDGRDAANAYSSAQDVYLMTAAMMRNERLMSITQNNAYKFYSKSDPPHEYAADSTLAPHMTNGVIAGKTGSEVDAGANVSLVREVNGGSNRVVIVVLGSDLTYNEVGAITLDARWDDVNALIAAMDSQFTWTNPAENGVIPGLTEQLMVWDLQFKDPPAVPIPNSGVAAVAFQLQVGTVVKEGEPAGTLYLYYGDTPVGELPLFQAAIASQ